MPALILLSYASLFILGLLDNIRGPYFADILTDLHLSGKSGSTFFAMTSFMAFVGSWSGHRVAARKSSLFLLVVSSFFMAFGFAWISGCGTLAPLLVGSAAFGLAYGGYNLSQNLMVVEASPRNLRRRYFNGLHSMYGLAAILAPLTASAFRWFGFTWRQGFLSLAFLPLLLVVASPFCKTSKGGLAVEPAQPMNKRDWSRCLLFAVMMAFYLWGEVSISTRLALWLRTDLAFTPDRADLYLAGFFTAMLTARLFFSFVHFAKLSSWVILCASAGFGGAFYLLALHSSPLWMLLCGLAMGPFFPMGLEQVSTSFHGKSSEALGFVLGVGSFSVVVMHLVIGYCTDRFGLNAALHVAPTALLVISGAIGVVLLKYPTFRAQMVEPKSL